MAEFRFPTSIANWVRKTVIRERNLTFYLSLEHGSPKVEAGPVVAGGRRATYSLSALSARDRSGRQICRGIYVCPDRRSKAAAEVHREPDLLLPAMCGIAGDGIAAGGRAEHGGVGHDSRTGQRGTVSESGGMGRAAGNSGAADFW